MPISDEQFVALVPEIVESARASQRTIERFVPPRLGIVEEASARRHRLVYGRRGVGKSTLLRAVERRVSDEGGVAVFIDLETLRGIPYPDVLIQLLIELFDALAERLRHVGGTWRQRVRLFKQRRRLRRLSRFFRRLLAEPQTAEHTVRKLRAKARGASIGIQVPSDLRRYGP